MADSKELQTQLQINQQINKVLADRSKQMDAMSKQLSGQALLAKELCKAMECKELDGLEDRIAGISSSLSNAADTASKAGASFSEASNALSSMGSKGGDVVKGLGAGLGGILDKITPMKAAAAGATHGMVKGFMGVMDSISMVAGGIGTVVSGLFKVGTSIASIPFKILGGFVSAAASTTGGVNELRVAMEKVRGEFGDLATGEGKAIIDGFNGLRASSSALAQSGLSVGKVFGYGSGGAAAMLQAVSDIAKAAGPQFTMLRDQIAGSADKMVMMNKGLGMTNEALAEMARQAHNAGRDVGSDLVEMGSMAIQMGNKFGVSAKTIGKNVSTLTADVANFGNMSKKELTATATYMAKLGMEAKDLQGVIDKFDDFESAAGSVAQLNQAFGIQLDTMEMMNAQNPAERIDMMRNAFHAAGKSVDDMSRAEKKLMAEQMGLSVSAMENALAVENQGIAYEDMEAAAEEAEANKMSEVDVMKELAKSVEKLVQGGSGVSGFFDAFSKGFERGFAQNKQYRESILAIKQSLQVVMDFGVKLGRMFADLLENMGLFDAIKKIFDPTAIKALFDKILGFFQKFSDSVKSGGDYSLSDLMSDVFGEVWDYLTKGAGAEGASAFGKFFEKIIKFMGDALASLIPWVLEKITSLINFIADVLADPSKLQPVGKAGEGIGGAFMEALSKIGEALGKALPPLWEAVKRLFWELLKKVGPFLLKVLAGIIAVHFVKAVVTGLIQAAAAGAVTKIIGWFTKKVGGDVGKGLDKNAGKAMQKEGGGFFKGMKNMITEIGKISPKAVAKAGANLLIIAAFATVSLIAFAKGMAIAAGALASVPFTALLKVFAMVGLAILATVVMSKVAKLIKVPQLLQAGIALVAGGIFFTVSVLSYALGIKALHAVIGSIPFEEFGKILGMVGIAILATIALGAIGAALAPVVPFMPVMAVGLVAAASLFTAGVLVFAEAIKTVLPQFKMMAKNEKAIRFSLEAIIEIVKSVALLGVLSAVFAAIGIFVKVLSYGFGVAASFFIDTVGDITEMVKAIMKIPLTDPKAADERIQIVGKLAGAMQKIADIGLQAAKLAMAAEMLKDGGMAEVFEGMNKFLNTISGVIINMVTMIVQLGSGLPKTDKEGINIIIEVIKAVTGLAQGMMAPLETVGKMSTGMFGEDVNKAMSAIVTGLRNIMNSIKTALPELIKIVVDAAKGIENPNTLKPKMDVVTKALEGVSGFGTSMGEVMKQVPPDTGKVFSDSMKSRLAKMTEKMNGVIGVVKDQIQTLVSNLLGVNISDPDGAMKKLDVITKSIDAVAKFAGVIEKLAGVKAANPEGVGPIITSTVQVMRDFLVGEKGSLQTLMGDLAGFSIDEKSLKPLTDSISAMDSLISFGQKVQGFQATGGAGTDMAQVVVAMVENAKSAITALNGIGEVSAVVALENFAKAIGTGDGKFNVTNEPVNITLNVQVTMDADKVGKVLVDKSVMTTALATAEG
jgi:hypothetical protein